MGFLQDLRDGKVGVLYANSPSVKVYKRASRLKEATIAAFLYSRSAETLSILQKRKAVWSTKKVAISGWSGKNRRANAKYKGSSPPMSREMAIHAAVNKLHKFVSLGDIADSKSKGALLIAIESKKWTLDETQFLADMRHHTEDEKQAMLLKVKSILRNDTYCRDGIITGCDFGFLMEDMSFSAIERYLKKTRIPIEVMANSLLGYLKESQYEDRYYSCDVYNLTVPEQCKVRALLKYMSEEMAKDKEGRK